MTSAVQELPGKVDQLPICSIMDFVSLGMLIIDDIYYPEPHPPMLSVLGGAGTYATLGARLYSHASHGATHSKDVGFVVHVGRDFDEKIMCNIMNWNTGSRFIETPERLCTRGKNTYRNGLREFEFLTEKIQVSPGDLTDRMLRSKVYHLICTPARCIELVRGILEKRAAMLTEHLVEHRLLVPEPIFLWEPMEGSCRPEHIQAFTEALRFVDVFSPNEHELASLFRGQTKSKPTLNQDEVLEIDCERIFALGFDKKRSALVVRMGAEGCLVATMGKRMRIPAWHSHATIAPGFDVTGGGNTFMGGFAAGILASDSLHEGSFTKFEIGAIYGTVAASYAIEQVGMPKLSYRSDGTELWNETVVHDRLALMYEKVPRTVARLSSDSA